MKDAMMEEYLSIMKNDVWEVVMRPKGKSVVTSKWIYKIKMNLVMMPSTQLQEMVPFPSSSSQVTLLTLMMFCCSRTQEKLAFSFGDGG